MEQAEFSVQGADCVVSARLRLSRNYGSPSTGHLPAVNEDNDFTSATWPELVIVPQFLPVLGNGHVFSLHSDVDRAVWAHCIPISGDPAP